MFVIGLILALIGVLIAVFWRRDVGLVLAVVGVVFLLVGFFAGNGAGVADVDTALAALRA